MGVSELSLLSYIVQNPDEYPALEPMFREVEFKFSNSVVEMVHVAVKEAWVKHGCVPSQGQLKHWLQGKRAFQQQPEKAATITNMIDRAFEGSLDGIDKNIVLGEVLLTQTLLMRERLGGMDSHNFEAEVDWFQQRLDTLKIISQQDRGQWAYPLDDKWIDAPEKTLATYLGNPIPFPKFPRITHMLSGGGRRGELMLPAALPGDGKTMFLVTMIAQLVLAGHRVYIAQLDNTFEEFIAKVWACMLSCSTDELLNPSNETRLKLKMLRRDHPDIHRLLVVRKWPRGTKTMSDLKRDVLLFKKLLRPYDESRGITKNAGGFSVVMGDYIDTFTSEKHYKEARFGHDEVVKRCAGFCEEEEVFGVFPTQLNRTTKYIETPDIDNLAEAFSKSHHAAIIPMFYASKMERMQGLMNIFWPKTRRPKEKFVTPMIRNTYHQKFSENEDLEVFYLDAGNGAERLPQANGAKPKKPKLKKPEGGGEEPGPDTDVVVAAKKLTKAVKEKESAA